MQCEICENKQITVKEMPHKIFGISDLVSCNKCGHKSFIPKEKIKRQDENFSISYSNTLKHINGLLNTFKTRRYFIDFSRLVLLSHYKFLDDEMKILEIGPGFPGMFQQLRLTNKKMNFYAIEPESKSRELLKDYGVNVIGSYFPCSQYDSYANHFSAIFICNILYYFNKPIKALEQIINLLNKNGIALIDIMNDKVLTEDYFKKRINMTHVFTKNSLNISIEKAGGEIKFLDTCSVKEPQTAFNQVERIGNNIPKKILNKFKLKLGVESQITTIKYFAQATELKYGDPEGQYIRAVIKRK